MNHYNYSSYCQRPDEVDLGVFQLSPVQSPTTAAREQHFLQELRNLRTGVGNGSYRDVPIAMNSGFNSMADQAPPPQNVHSLHRTFSDSNVIVQPPQYTLRSRDPPSWMANPPPPFSRPVEGYNSLDRNMEQSRSPGRPGFLKCASPTPWQSSDNLVREPLDRAPQRQRFFSPAPRQENRWEPEKTHWQREPEDEVRTTSRWESLPNVQEQPRFLDCSRFEREPELGRSWEHEISSEPRQSRHADWEQPKRHQQQQVRPRDLSLSRLEARGSNWDENWAGNQPKVEQWNRGPKQSDSWADQNVQQRQQVQRDLLQEIREHRQQEAARQQQENQYRGQEPNWRQQPSTPLTPLFGNRTSRRGEWEQSRGRESEWEQKSQPRQRDQSASRNSGWERPYSSESYQNDWNHNQSRYQQDQMARSQEHGREGLFVQPQVQNRAMTEPPTRDLGMLDRAMQNRVQEHHTLGPELEMDVTVTHSSYRNGEGRTVPTSPQRHSYAGTFSEFSRNQNPSSYSQESRPRSLAYENSSLASSPAISPPNEFNLPTSPIQRSASLHYPPTTKTGAPIWELDTIYGLNGGQRSYRNGEQAQRSTVTTPMYGRGTLNERQSVERTTAVVNPLVVEQPKPQPVPAKHSGILLNPNEGRKSVGSKRRVMFRDEEEQDDFYGKNFAETADAPVHVKSYDAAIEDQVSRFVSLSEQIGGDVAAIVTKFTQALDLHRHFLWQAASQPKPSDDAFQKLFQPLLDAAEDISKFKDSKRQSSHFNHLNVIAEGIPALGWVTIPKTPAPYIQNALEASMFYLNRILKEYKDKDQKHVDWVKTFQEFMKELQTFVRQTHTTGLVWNSAPGQSPAPMSGKTSAPSAGSSGPGGPPPPPPPPPMNLFDDMPKAAAPSSDKAGRDALFQQLNQGSNITSGLKKVTADMQTHKNPNLRSTSTVPSSSNTSVASSVGSPSRVAAPVQKPPRIELENGKQWAVEFHNGNKNVVVEITDKKQSVYVYKCDNCVVQVKGKCNSVALDGCKKTAIVVDGVVAQIETVNCQSVQIQTMGDMPTLSIQKTDGCQVYLSEASKDCEIVTSKSSEMNVLVPEGKDGDFIELPLPEQFKTVYKGGKLVTTVSDI